MQVTYSTTFRDFANAQALHAKRSEASYIANCLGRYIYPIFGLAVMLFEFTPHHVNGSPPSKLVSALCGSALILIPVFLHLNLKRCYNRSGAGSGACTIDFDDDGIRAVGAHSKSELEWSAIQSHSEDKNVFLLYLAPARFLPVPKRFCTVDQVNELRLLLENKMKYPKQ